MTWVDLSKSEPSTQLNSSDGSWLKNDLAKFPLLGSEDLIRLGEDFLHVHPIYIKNSYNTGQDDEYLLSISNMISMGKVSPTGLSSEDATALAETFRKVPLPRQTPSQRLTSLVVRSYSGGLLALCVAIQTRRSDF